MRATAAAKPILNGPEQQLYGRLVRAFPGHVIMAQVAMTQWSAGDHARAHFVVCKSDFTALAVIELDAAGSFATPRDRRERQRRDHMFEGAGIKVIRVPLEDIPREPALKALVAALPLHPCASRPMRRAS